MRNTLDIIPNPALKGLSYKIPHLPSVSANSIIKLTQGKNIVYFKYDHHENESMISNNNNAIQLPQKLCEFNNFVKGPAHYQQVFNIKQCKKVTLFVSKLDWQIVNNKAQMLEQQVMNQINIVWPKAIMPLYYDKNNFVKIRVSCESVGGLAQNSELSILVDQEEEEKKKEKEDQYLVYKLKILPIVQSPEGNINKVYLRKEHPIFKENCKAIKINFDKKSEGEGKNKNQKGQDLNEKNSFWLQFQKSNSSPTVPSDTNILSIKQQVSLIKSMKQNREEMKKLCKKQKQKIVVQVYAIDDSSLLEEWNKIQQKRLIKQVETANQKAKDKIGVEFGMKEDDDEFMNEKNCLSCIMLGESAIKYWGISLQNCLKITRRNKIEGESKTLEYLLKMKDTNIRIGISEQREEKQENVGGYFISSLMRQLKIKRKIRVFHKIPYFVNPILKNKQSYPQFAFIQFRNKEQIMSECLEIVHAECLKKQKKRNEQKSMDGLQKQREDEGQVQQQLEISKDGKRQKNQDEEDIEIENQRRKLSSEDSNLVTRLKQIAKVNNYFYSNQNVNEIKTKATALNSLDKALVIAQKDLFFQTQQPNAKYSCNSLMEQQNVFEYLYRKCYASQIQRVLDLVSNYFKMVEQKGYSFYLLPILITSFANNGKTVFNSILASNNHQTLYIDISQMDDTSHNLPDLYEFLQISFQLSKPNIIFMDNLDSVCYKIDKGDAHRRQQRIASKLLLRKIMILSQTYRKLCIFTAKNQGNIDEQLIHYELVKLKNPDRETRQKILNQYSQENENKYSKAQIQQMVQNSQSMSFGQFSKYVIKGHREQISQTSSYLNFSKLAGIHQIKKMLRAVVERPLKYSFVFKKLPIKLSRGVLLYGGSGTGKSAIGEALAGQFKMKYFNVKGSDILSKYIGGSEAAVRDIFEKAMSVSPSIVFFDEFQSIVPRRNSSNTGVTDRVVNQFLCYLDGVASIQGVYIIAASSRPQLIDPALLRPGRIDTHIFLDLPTKQERSQLLSLYSNSIEFETSQQEILKITEGFSYSDLIGLIKELRIKKSGKIIKDYKAEDSKIDSKEFKRIEDNFFKEILTNFRVPTTKQERDKEREKYLAFKRGDAPDISKQKSMLK